MTPLFHDSFFNTPDALSELLMRLHDGLTAAGIPDELVYHAELTAEELAADIITNAYPERTPDSLTLDIIPHDGSLMMTLSYGGVHYDPLTRMQPVDLVSGIAGRKTKGLGLYLVRSAGDYMFYDRVQDRNVITLQLKK